MNKEKQIEEMVSDLENHTCMSRYQAEIASRMLYVKGYRKASEVAREIFEELESIFYLVSFPVQRPMGSLTTKTIEGIHMRNEDYHTIKKKYTEEVADWKAIAEQYQKQFENCAEDRAKLTEENEAWQKQLISQEEQSGKAYYDLACEVEDLRAENERLRAIPEQLHKEMSERMVEECKIERKLAVRKMQERLKAEMSFGRYIQVDQIDQIAKEMLEGKNES
jgi:hypothetical protein